MAASTTLNEIPDDDTDRFQHTLTTLSDSTRHLLETYSHIPSDEVVSHVTAIRNKAWTIHPYPCIGRWRFLDLGLGLHSQYHEVVARLKTGDEKLLDLGCAFGQDIRRLVADGVDGKQLYGSDLRLDFLELGYELFRDKETLETEFFEADVFATGGRLEALEGGIDILHASSFFHLFDRPAQKKIALRVVKILKPKAGSLLLGRQAGSFDAGEVPRQAWIGTHFRHNEASWRELWDEVGKEAGGVEFETKATLREMVSETGITGPGMQFTVRRL